MVGSVTDQSRLLVRLTKLRWTFYGHRSGASQLLLVANTPKNLAGKILPDITCSAQRSATDAN